MRRLFEGGAYSSNYCNWQLRVYYIYTQPIEKLMFDFSGLDLKTLGCTHLSYLRGRPPP